MNQKYILGTMVVAMSMVSAFLGYAQQISQEADNVGQSISIEFEAEVDNASAVTIVEAEADNSGVIAVDKSAQMVEAGKTIQLHYTLKVNDEVVDTSDGREPLELEIGLNKVIPGFENGLMGLKSGEEKTFSIPPEEAYGTENPEAFKEVEKTDLPAGTEPVVGQVLYIQGPDGQSYPVRIHEVKEQTVMLNFNHPLAGETLEFTVRIVDIR